MQARALALRSSAAAAALAESYPCNSLPLCVCMAGGAESGHVEADDYEPSNTKPTRQCPNTPTAAPSLYSHLPVVASSACSCASEYSGTYSIHHSPAGSW